LIYNHIVNSEIDNLYGKSDLDIYAATRGIFIKQSSLEEKESMAESKVFYTILPK